MKLLKENIKVLMFLQHRIKHNSCQFFVRLISVNILKYRKKLFWPFGWFRFPRTVLGRIV